MRIRPCNQCGKRIEMLDDPDSIGGTPNVVAVWCDDCAQGRLERLRDLVYAESAKTTQALMADLLERGIEILKTQYSSDKIHQWIRDAREMLEVLRAEAPR